MDSRLRAVLSRRAAVGRGGAVGAGLGLLATAGARDAAAQDWKAVAATPTVGAQPAAPPFPGLTGGLAPFTHPLESSSDVQQVPFGTVRWARARQMATLSGVAMASEILAPGGLRELHWHLNAHELSYCLAGSGRFGVFASDGTGETFDIRPGSITFMPNGYTHFIENTGPDELHLILTFTDEQPETIDLSQTLPSLPLPLLAQTFGVTADGFPFLPVRGDRSIVQALAATPPATETAATPAPSEPSAYSIHVDRIPAKEFGGGSVRPLSRKELPIIEGITVYPLQIVPGGLREPHWHPGTSEMNYCVSGRAQIGLIAPDGSLQTFAVEPGTVAFIPQNWFHYIANLGDDPLAFLVFFVNPNAEAPHIDLSQTIDFFPPAVVAASFGVDSATFAALPQRGDIFLAAPVETEG